MGGLVKKLFLPNGMKQEKFTKGLVGLNPRGRVFLCEELSGCAVGVQGRDCSSVAGTPACGRSPQALGNNVCLAGGKYKMT